MTLKAPELPDKYNIASDVEGFYIDSHVKSVLKTSLESPILKTGSASELLHSLDSALPRKGSPLESVLEELDSAVVQYCRKNAHPGCWAYVTSPGLPTDPLGHAITAALNQNVTGFHSAPGASVIEQTVIDWLVQLAEMPEGSGGLLQGGGSLANLSALAVARHKALGNEGLHGGPRPVLVVAETAHFSIIRAARLLGIGKNDIIFLKVNESQQMCTSSLQVSLETLAKSGHTRVIAVVATAGTTTSGAIDPLAEIAGICKDFDIWLHVDAAYGGAALLSEDLHTRLEGIGKADSITLDLHKWCYMSVDCSVLLYRNPGFARDMFSVNAEYVREDAKILADASIFFDLSPELSRRFRALAVWLAFRHYGIEILGRNVYHNVECAEYLAKRIKMIPDLELVAWPQLSICCFRYLPSDRKISENEIDRLNDNIVKRLAEEGNYLLSSTNLVGRSVLRVCIRSYTTRAVHIDRFIEDVCRIGESELGLM